MPTPQIPHLRLVAPVLLAVLALAAGPAEASTVNANINNVTYQAAPGETNNVNIHIDWFNQSKFYIDDPGAVIAVTGACHSIDVHHAYCDNVLWNYVYVYAEDGNDTVHATNRSWIHGGPGDDSLSSDDSGFLGVWHYDSVIWGDDGNDHLWGNGGNDTLDGGPGDDVVDGGGDDDTIHATAGADDLAGGWGNDTLTYQWHSPGVALYVGNLSHISGNADDGVPGARDLIRGDFETVVGTSGDDTIDGSDGNDVLMGMGGDDRLWGWNGNDTLRGGDGNDNFWGGAGDDLEQGDAGDDRFEASDSGRDDFSGGDGSDTVTYEYAGSGVTANLNGAADDGPWGAGDTIRTDVENLKGSDYADQLTGDDRPNTIVGNGGGDHVYGLGGDDSRQGQGDCDELQGGDGNDSLDGGDGGDFLAGAGGDDVLAPGEGYTDVAQGGAGVDRVTYAGRADGVSISPDDQFNDGRPGEGDDVGSDVEQMTGGEGDDTLYGTAADNSLDGGRGNDRLYGRGGADTIIGSGGIDTVDYADRTEPLAISLDGQANDGSDANRDGTAEESDNVSPSVENVVAGQGPDRLTGNAEANTLDGRGGDDALAGADGSDTLYGSDGADVLDGGRGADKLIGEAGTDLADYSSRTAAVTVGIDGVANDGEAGEGDNVDITTENVTGGSGDDHLSGSSPANVINGGPGRDALSGGAGPDDLQGGPGYDTAYYGSRAASQPVTVDLDGAVGDDGGADDGPAGARDTVRSDVENITGGAGADVLSGGPSGNVISGGGGNDVLRGNGGGDRLIGEAGDDELAGGANDDILEGGPGTDRAVYSERAATQPVAVTIGAGTRDDGGALDGLAGARDDVRADVEDVAGGAGNDTLIGSGVANLLLGAAGNDTLRGAGGADRLDGGAGDDALDSVDTAPDGDVCGIGLDTVTADALDVVAADCETRV